MQFRNRWIVLAVLVLLSVTEKLESAMMSEV